jgi:MerR family transcriptional regulator, glutamine synthetase repressor
MSMKSKKSSPVLSIRTVMELTNLSARQIRYYEEHNLVQPYRTEGKRRVYSLQHVDELLEIQNLLDQGINIAGIKKIFEMKQLDFTYTYKGRQLTEKQLRELVMQEYLMSV